MKKRGTESRLAWVLIVVALGGPVGAQPYRDAQLPIEKRVQDLVSRMTVEEKFWQLFMLAGGLDEGTARYEKGAFGFQLGSVCAGRDPARCADDIQRHFVENTRLGIPVILFEEALHGLVQPGATAFPQAIGLAATFDTDLMREVSGAIAAECRAHGVRQVLSPVVNIAEDVRWGRVEETYGEDPFLAAEMGVAFTAGFAERSVVTTPKHLVANVGAGGRDSYPNHDSERRLRELHLPPFEACIRRGGSRSIMTAYNSLDGIPSSASAWLNRRWLKDEIGFTGFVISDAGAVGGANVLHFTAADSSDSTVQALRGGLDVIFQTSFDHVELFFPPFRDGRISPEVIDRAVARVLRVKFELGLFEQPYVGSDDRVKATRRERHRALARRAAEKSIVLLENREATLPLGGKLQRIAVLGPDADEVRLGGYSGAGNDPVPVLDGIRRAAPATTRVEFSRGCTRQSPELPTIPGEFLVHGEASRPGLEGEYFDNIDLAGEPVLSRVDAQIRFQWTLSSPDPERLRNDFYSVRWRGRLRAPADGLLKIGVEGNDGYRLYLDDERILDNWRKVSSGTRLAEVRLEKGREYALRLEYFEPRGNAKLRLVWDHGVPPPEDAAMEEAVELARRSDVAIVVVGIEEGEFRDRAKLGLPGRQPELIRRVAATGKPTVVVLVGGSAVTMSDWLEDVSAVLAVWYPGEAGGAAVGDVLFGKVDPAGRLPITFPISEGQLPLVYNHEPTGRGDDYMDLTGAPQFPFGHGLTYTRFVYGDLRVEPARIVPGDSAVVHLTLKNAGERAGDEVVQVYLRDPLASVVRPVLWLAGFRRVHLQAGEQTTVSFEIDPASLGLLDREMRRIVEPGEYRILVGASSKDIRVQGNLQVADAGARPVP